MYNSSCLSPKWLLSHAVCHFKIWHDSLMHHGWNWYSFMEELQNHILLGGFIRSWACWKLSRCYISGLLHHAAFLTYASYKLHVAILWRGQHCVIFSLVFEGIFFEKEVVVICHFMNYCCCMQDSVVGWRQIFVELMVIWRNAIFFSLYWYTVT